MPDNVDEFKGHDRGTGEWWMQRIRNAKDTRKKYSSIDRWDDIEQYWLHQFEVGDPVFNMVYMFGRTLIPDLVFQSPTIRNIPRFPQFIPMASVMDSIDELLIQEMELEDVMRDSVLNAYLYNMGCPETSFDFPDLIKADDDPTGILTQLSEAGFGGVTGVTDRARRQNFPWFDVIPPRQLLFDQMAKKTRTARFYAKDMFIPTRILKEDKTLIQKNVNPTPIQGNEIDPNLREFLDRTRSVEEFTGVYEIHDQEEGQWMWLSHDGKFLFEPTEDPFQVDGLNIDPMMFNPNPLSIWGTPDTIYIEPMMLDNNDSRKKGMLQRKVALLKFLVDENVLSKEEIDKLFEEDIVVLRVQGSPTSKLSEAVVQLQPHIQGELLGYQNQLVQDAGNVSGMGPNQTGQFNRGRRTAQEVATVEQHNQIRNDDRRQMVAKQITMMFRKVNQFVTRHWTEPILVRVVGADASRYFVRVRPTDITMEMSVRVDVESLQPPSKERDKQEMLEMAQIMATVSPEAAFEILRQLLSRFPWADVDRFLPVANQGQEMGLQEFEQTQQQALAGGGDRGAAAQNVQALIQVS